MDTLRMRLRIPGLLLAALLVGAAALAASFREELTKVPRIRVGPLVSEEPANERLRLFALGDTGTGDEVQLRVAAAMEQRCREVGGVDGILLLGDNAYQTGFASVEDPQWQTKVQEPYGSPCLDKAPIFPVLGNHDYKDNPSAQIEYSLVWKRWRMPNRFYAVDFGTLARLVAFDSETSELCLRPEFCTVDFLLDAVRKSKATWTLVMAHHPLNSSDDAGYAQTSRLRRTLLQPFLCDRADAWISGHAHLLEHRQPKDCRLELFISGGGGAELHGVVPDDPESRFAQALHGFLELELDGQRMVSRFVGRSGEVLYEATKTKAQR